MPSPAPRPVSLRSVLTAPRFARRPDLVVAYLALSCAASGDAVDLAAARDLARHALGEAAWEGAVAALARDGVLFVEALEARLAGVASGAFEAAWEAFAGAAPGLRARTVAAYRAEAVKALEAAGFAVAVDERVPAGAEASVPVHALAEAGGERLALVCCKPGAVEAWARRLRAASVARAYLLVHPDGRLVDARAVKVSERRERFDPAAVDLPGNVPREAWLRWVRYRREKGAPLTPESVTQQLKVLAQAGDEAVAVIEKSINSSWRGLFPPKRRGGEPAPRGADAPPPPFRPGDLVEVRLQDGRVKVVTAEVVASAYVIDEHGDTHPLARVSPHQPLRRAS